MSKSSRYLAFFAYLLSLPGALFVLLARRDDAFAVYHARQSLGLAITTIVLPLLWLVAAWALAWIPLAGGMIGVLLFALLIACFIALTVSWIAGLVYAWQGRVKQIPFVGERFGKLPPAPTLEPVAAAEPLVDRRTTIDA